MRTIKIVGVCLTLTVGLITGIACKRPPGGTRERTPQTDETRVGVGAERLLGEEFARIKGKRVAIVANQTSVLPSNGVHLVDALLRVDVKVVKVFAPEHGFRGETEAGGAVSSGKDPKTGTPIVSLYGAHKKPTPADLADIDVVLFDIQDVGARFYTYLATLQYVMEACAESRLPIIVLDRPNPNGRFVGGPVLQPEARSFVGLVSIPIIHGLTAGEYAQFLNGEILSKRAALSVVKMDGYRHSKTWAETGLPWRAPSPNLPTVESAELYPYLCWYEGTIVSVGRGTDSAFTRLGFPYHLAAEKQMRIDSVEGFKATFSFGHLQAEALCFTPRSIPGKSASPMYENQNCYGYRLRVSQPDTAGAETRFFGALRLLGDMRHEYYAYFERNKSAPPRPFFNDFFMRLSGRPELARQIDENVRPEKIIESWRPQVNAFLKKRQKYLLYP